MEDIFAYAAKCVKNKSVPARIAHSAKLHNARSAMASKGSAASKFMSLAGSGARATVNCIPIPVIGGLAGAAEQKFEKAVKRYFHSRRKENAPLAEEVKFTLKDLSVQELDRYRWKVSESITEFNKLVAGHTANLEKKREALAPCDAYLDLALAAEQVKRRIKILSDACLIVLGAVQITSKWIEECENGPGAVLPEMIGGNGTVATRASVNGMIAELRTLLADSIKKEVEQADRYIVPTARDEYIRDSHGMCSNWCCFRREGTPDTWANCRSHAAAVLRALTDPFVPDSFNNNLGVLWKDD